MEPSTDVIARWRRRLNLTIPAGVTSLSLTPLRDRNGLRIYLDAALTAWVDFEEMPEALCGPEVDVALQDLAWKRQEIVVFNKVHTMPRSTISLYRAYRYAGREHPVEAPNAVTDQEKAWIAKHPSVQANLHTHVLGCLGNWYSSGQDYIGAHSDSESFCRHKTYLCEDAACDAPTVPHRHQGTVVLCCSRLGSRTLVFRHRQDKKKRPVIFRVDVPPGILYVMSGRCQEEWMHEFPIRKRVTEQRLSTTWRLFDQIKNS